MVEEIRYSVESPHYYASATERADTFATLEAATTEWIQRQGSPLFPCWGNAGPDADAVVAAVWGEHGPVEAVDTWSARDLFGEDLPVFYPDCGWDAEV